ncbi:MAG: LptF/LptG family permease [Chitinophagaceae bacterium]
MFKKLDWYIFRQFFVTFIFCMLLFTVIAVAVDSSEKTDDFVKSGLSTSEIINQYYVGFIPYIWGLLYPLFVFIAVIFFTSKMAVRAEIIAILASGVTYNRWLSTYFAGGVFFATVLWFAARYAIPKANEIRSDFQTTYVESSDPNNYGSSSAYYFRSDSNTYIGFKYFDTATKTGSSFFLNRLKNNKLVYNLRADNLKWDTVKRNWKLNNITERNIDSTREVMRHLDSLNMHLNFVPADLNRDYYLKDKLNTPALVNFIQLEELRGNEGLNTLKAERYRRSATPASVLILTMIGAMIAGRRTRGGSGLHLAIGIIIAAIFIVLDRFSTVFSTKGNLHPLLAAWVPNVIFTFVALFVYKKAPK